MKAHCSFSHGRASISPAMDDVLLSLGRGTAITANPNLTLQFHDLPATRFLSENEGELKD
jgi:hypothetical protein